MLMALEVARGRRRYSGWAFAGDVANIPWLYHSASLGTAVTALASFPRTARSPMIPRHPTSDLENLTVGPKNAGEGLYFFIMSTGNRPHLLPRPPAIATPAAAPGRRCRPDLDAAASGGASRIGAGFRHAQAHHFRPATHRLAVENRDLKMRLSAIETDYANLFSYVEGTQGEG